MQIVSRDEWPEVESIVPIRKSAGAVTSPSASSTDWAPYQQIAAQLRQEIAAGSRAPGSRLPSVVTIVQETGVADFTARKALRLLIAEGLAEMVPGMGTYVREPGGDPE
jgi:DNA-binding GntR family transcriptional regulator